MLVIPARGKGASPESMNTGFSGIGTALASIIVSQRAWVPGSSLRSAPE
jgi:hypothetical protein